MNGISGSSFFVQEGDKMSAIRPNCPVS